MCLANVMCCRPQIPSEISPGIRCRSDKLARAARGLSEIGRAQDRSAKRITVARRTCRWVVDGLGEYGRTVAGVGRAVRSLPQEVQAHILNGLHVRVR